MCRATYHNLSSRTTGGKQKLVEIAVSQFMVPSYITLKSYILLVSIHYIHIIGTTIYLKI